MAEDPRPAISRAKLIGAAVALLNTGDPHAVTVAAVTRASSLARGTLYRQFRSIDDLIAAALDASLPPVTAPPRKGSLHTQLTGCLISQAESLAHHPAALQALCWLGSTHRRYSRETHTLRRHVLEHYAQAFDEIFDSPAAVATLGPVNRTEATALLLGPVIFGTITLSCDFDHRACARSAVDAFLASHTLRDRSAQ